MASNYYTQDKLPNPVLTHLQSNELTTEILNEYVPTTGLQTSLIVSATIIDSQIDERQYGHLLYATPKIPLIESNFGISTYRDDSLPSIIKQNRKKEENKKKKRPTSNRQVVSTIFPNCEEPKIEVLEGNKIRQFMNASIQYNVLCNGRIYRIKRYRTGNIQVPNTQDEYHASDAEEAIKEIINYEREFFQKHGIPYKEVSIPKMQINLLNYKFILLMGWLVKLELVVPFFQNYQKTKCSESGGHVPNNLPFIEDEDLTLDNLYILNINMKKRNSIIYVSFYIPTRLREQRDWINADQETRNRILNKRALKERERRANLLANNEIELTATGRLKKVPNGKRKNITVSISHKGFCNIQGGMENRKPTQLVFEFILSVFRNNPHFFTRKPLTDEELLLRQSLEKQ